MHTLSNSIKYSLLIAHNDQGILDDSIWFEYYTLLCALSLRVSSFHCCNNQRLKDDYSFRCFRRVHISQTSQILRAISEFDWVTDLLQITKFITNLNFKFRYIKKIEVFYFHQIISLCDTALSNKEELLSTTIYKIFVTSNRNFNIIRHHEIYEFLLYFKNTDSNDNIQKQPKNNEKQNESLNSKIIQ